MTEDTIVAALSAFGLLSAAEATAVGVGFGLLWRRISELEGRVQKIAEAEARIRWWAYDVKDLYYRHRKPDAPDLPPMPEPEDEK